MNRHRIFSNNTSLNYNEYTSKKVGKTILENIYMRGPYSGDSNYTVKQNIITQVFDYNTFLLLSKAYFNLYECCHHKFQPPITITNATNSFLCYENILSHIQNCNYCYSCTNIYDIKKCNEIKNILYPYGLYVNEEINLFYPYPLDLTNISFCKPPSVNIEKPQQYQKSDPTEIYYEAVYNPSVPVYYPPFSKEEFNPNYRFVEKRIFSLSTGSNRHRHRNENNVIYPSQFNFQQTRPHNRNVFI
jgi:hypothetical protein